MINVHGKSHACERVGNNPTGNLGDENPVVKGSASHCIGKGWWVLHTVIGQGRHCTIYSLDLGIEGWIGEL